MDYSLLVGVNDSGAPTHPSRRLNPHLLPVSTDLDVFEGTAEQQDAGAALATAAAQVSPDMVARPASVSIAGALSVGDLAGSLVVPKLCVLWSRLIGVCSHFVLQNVAEVDRRYPCVIGDTGDVFCRHH